jgi:DnaJ like chaperone protein
MRTSDAQSLDSAYRVLGVGADTSDDDVKKAYRRLMNQHHPDKLVARGLPQSMIGIAEQKTHEVRAAYEKVKAQRGFK